MSKKNSNSYFDTFVELIEYSCKAADYLYNAVTNFDKSTLSDKIRELHLIEHTADRAKHDMMQKLSADFITPIEREDIIELSHTIDDITDALEDILRRMYMYDVKSMREDAKEFCSIIKESLYRRERRYDRA